MPPVPNPALAGGRSRTARTADVRELPPFLPPPLWYVPGSGQEKHPLVATAGTRLKDRTIPWPVVAEPATTTCAFEPRPVRMPPDTASPESSALVQRVPTPPRIRTVHYRQRRAGLNRSADFHAQAGKPAGVGSGTRSINWSAMTSTRDGLEQPRGRPHCHIPSSAIPMMAGTTSPSTCPVSRIIASINVVAPSPTLRRASPYARSTRLPTRYMPQSMTKPNTFDLGHPIRFPINL